MSLMFLNTINPLPLSLILIMLALVEGLLVWGYISKWLGLALIMVFVGGMMVAFLYVSSLSFNLKFQLFIPTLSMSSLMLLIVVFYWGPLKSFSMTSSGMVYSNFSSFILLFLIGYLLVVLFLAVKITESLKGSLAKKF